MARLEPVSVQIEEALFRPVAGGDEENQEEERAVYARPVEEVGQDKEGEDEAVRFALAGGRFREG